MSNHPLRIFTGSAHPELASAIAEALNVPLGRATTRIFPDSETHITIDEVVRGNSIFLIQPCPAPVNEHLMELLLYLDAFRRASAYSVTVVMPYFPYARQDRMVSGREAISARVVANLLETQGADRVIFVDIHNRATQGFFNIPVDPLSAIPLLAEYFKKAKFEKSAIVSPDAGRAKVAVKYAELLGLPLVVMHKRREEGSKVKATHVVGDIRGRRPIIIDDIIAGGSVLSQLDALYDQGAEGKAYFAITHPVLLPTAIEILDRDDRIGKLVVTDTVPLSPEKRNHPKIKIISVAKMIAQVIYRIHEGASISDMLVMS